MAASQRPVGDAGERWRSARPSRIFVLASGLVFVALGALPGVNAVRAGLGPQKIPATPRGVPTATPTPVPTPRVLRARNGQVTLIAAGDEVRAELLGQNLDSIMAAELVRGDSPLVGVTVRIVAAKPGSVQVAMKASAGVGEAMGLQLRLIARAGPVLVPVSLFRIDVKRDSAPLGAAAADIAGRRPAPTPTSAVGAGKAGAARAGRIGSTPIGPRPPPSPVGLSEPLAGTAQVTLDTEVWSQPRIQSFPSQGPAGEPIEIIGTGLGVPSDPSRTTVSFSTGSFRPRLEGEVVAANYRSLQVKVPHGAVTGKIRVTTPGGEAESGPTFEPVYLLHYPPDIFAPEGGLGFLHFDDSVLFLVNGERNSLLQVSSEMQVMGFADQFFTMEPYEQKIDAFVARTTLRVRIPGSDRADRSRIIRSHPLGFAVAGTGIVIDATFESEGWEYIGEYETQDLLSGEIHWKHFMDIDINDLSVKVTLPIEAGPGWYQPLAVGEVTAATTFTARLSVFDSPPFDVEETPIKDFIQDEVDAKVHATFNSDGFRRLLAAAFSRLVLDSPTFEGVRIRRYEILAAGDGGFDIKAVLAE